MILGFKPQFKPLILSGEKVHTIREDKYDRWKPGIKIHMATGVRTHDYECFCDKYTCVSTQRIHIVRYYIDQLIPYIYINYKPFFFHYQLAKNDGFKSVNDFYNWFPEEEFIGKIIHWTNLTY